MAQRVATRPRAELSLLRGPGRDCSEAKAGSMRGCVRMAEGTAEPASEADRPGTGLVGEARDGELRGGARRSGAELRPLVRARPPSLHRRYLRADLARNKRAPYMAPAIYGSNGSGGDGGCGRAWTLTTKSRRSRGRARVHLVQRPPKETRLRKQPSQKVHRHSLPAGGDGGGEGAAARDSQSTDRPWDPCIPPGRSHQAAS